MSNQKDSWQRIARAVSIALHPWLVFVPVVAVLAYNSTSTLIEWGKWTLVTVLLAYILPVLYVRVRADFLRLDGQSQISLRSIFRERPEEIALLACLFGIPGLLVLHYLNGPDTLLALLMATAGAMFVAALINFVNRVSLHMALVTAMLSSVWLVFGPVSLVTLPLIILVGLARYFLKEHTPDQITSGFVLGVVVTMVVFWGTGLAFGGIGY